MISKVYLIVNYISKKKNFKHKIVVTNKASKWL